MGSVSFDDERRGVSSISVPREPVVAVLQPRWIQRGRESEREVVINQCKATGPRGDSESHKSVHNRNH